MPGMVLKAFIVSKIPTGELDCGRVCFSAKLKPAGNPFFFFSYSSSTRGKELVSSRFIPKILLGRPWSLPCVSQMTCRLETAYPIKRRFPEAQRPVWGFHLCSGAAE